MFQGMSVIKLMDCSNCKNVQDGLSMQDQTKRTLGFKRVKNP
jgi:hypothetical protein